MFCSQHYSSQKDREGEFQGNIPAIATVSFPFSNKKVGLTNESLHFKSIDIAKEVMIPLPPHPGAFGVVRKHHTHEGVDLYCVEHEPVFAMESGVVVAIMKFTGPHAGTPWWHDTFAVAVSGHHGVINYGEINPASNLEVGAFVSRGQLLGNVLTVLRKDKGRPRDMLHLELYEPDAKISQGWEVGGLKPRGLLDPTELLLKAADLIK